MSEWTKNTALKTGHHPPEQCARGRTDCRSLHQLLSTEGDTTIVCCGEVKPGHTPEPRDKWCFCVRGDHTRTHCSGTDIRIFVDQRDMSHFSAVLSAGLAMVIPCDDER